MAFHKLQQPGEIHGIVNWVVADAAARAALSLIATDIGRVAKQTDTGLLYILSNNVGPVWTQLNLPAAGGVGQRLESDGTSFVSTYGGSRVLTDTTTARIIGLTDNGAYIRFTNTATKMVTFSPNSTTAYPDGMEVHIRNAAASNLTLTPGVGVTLNAPSAGTLIVPINGTVTVKKVTTNVWDVMGVTT